MTQCIALMRQTCWLRQACWLCVHLTCGARSAEIQMHTQEVDMKRTLWQWWGSGSCLLSGHGAKVDAQARLDWLLEGLGHLRWLLSV